MTSKYEIAIPNHDLQKLAQEIGSLRYDALILFLQSLRNEINRQSSEDHKNNRFRMALLLHNAGSFLNETIGELHRVWDISKKYMTEQFQNEPPLIRVNNR